MLCLYRRTIVDGFYWTWDSLKEYVYYPLKYMITKAINIFADGDSLNEDDDDDKDDGNNKVSVKKEKDIAHYFGIVKKKVE